MLLLRDVSADEIDIRNWEPESQAEVFTTLTMEIGWQGREGTNLFHVVLATPESLRKFRDDFVLVRNRTLVVQRYDFSKLVAALKSIVEESTRASWEDSCEVLSRYFYWEYEDFVNE